MSAHEIAHELMARPLPNRGGWLVLCPVHGDRRPSLSIRDGDDGRLLLKCFSGCDSREILKTLSGMGLLDGLAPVRRPEPQKPVNRAKTLNRIWGESIPIEGEGIVAKYMASRGIIFEDWPLDLREHPQMAVYADGKKTGQVFPALVAIIRNEEGQPSGLHVTFLKSDGNRKAEIENPRRIIGWGEGSTRGGTVRLMKPSGGQIGLGEGLESTLSASILTGIPGWSALTAGGIERAVLPPEIRRVVIFADRDPAGLKSAANACDRFRREGREAEILAPNEDKADFNDILKKETRASVTA